MTVALSLALAEGLDTDDLNALGNLLATVGSLIDTFGSLQPAAQTATKTQNDSTRQDFPCSC
ncbi:MAG: hypothetical protein FWG94_05230 [Oscillospiraceae bacterium]|nr:hypothetical protein [Oscillospiraceae bacterium]